MKMPGSFAFPGVFEFRAASPTANRMVFAGADTRACPATLLHRRETRPCQQGNPLWGS